MANDEITEKIIFCTERLESAVYYEDKEETLQILLDMCPENATKIGVYSINTIINSIQKSHSVFLQYKLLNAILSTEHREEFLDIILKSDQNVITIYTNLQNFKGVCKQLAVKNGYRVYKILSASNMLLLFIDNIACCVEYLKYLIYEENIQFFVFNGLFEQLLSLINDSNYNPCISTIERMLKCSLQAQNYFMELKWKTMLGEYNVNKICTALLDKRNTNFVNVQNYMIKEDLLDCNDFHFTNALIYKNVNAFLYAERKGLNAKLILNRIYSDDNLVVSYNLLAQFAKYKEIPLSAINEEDSHFYAILCILLVVNDNYNDLKGYIDNAQLALLQYKSTEARLLESVIVFIVLMTDALLHVYLVKEMLNDAELPVVYKSLLALAVCSKNIEKELLMINNELLLDYLCILRHNLVNDKLECADVVKEYLLQLLGAEIDKLNENMVHEEIVRNEIKEEEFVMAKTEETVVQEDKIEIDKITNYKKTFTKLFSVQKEVEEESGDDVYDL